MSYRPETIKSYKKELEERTLNIQYLNKLVYKLMEDAILENKNRIKEIKKLIG